MKNAVRFINIIVFVLSASVIISIFSEGVLLVWFSFVPILMITMDSMFAIATIVNLIYFRKRKILFALNLFSIFLFSGALITKALNWEHPVVFVAFWYFYILFYYYTAVIKQIWKYPTPTPTLVSDFQQQGAG